MSEENIRPLPQNTLDLDLMLTNSVWGKDEVPPELREKLNKYFLEKNEEGKDVVTARSLWGLLGFYTRDLRLGCLSTFDNELQTCRYMLDLAGDFLQKGYIEPFLICLSRVATILETSQSKGGFLRKQNSTLRTESYNQNLEPPKKGFFGGKKQEVNGGGY